MNLAMMFLMVAVATPNVTLAQSERYKQTAAESSQHDQYVALHHEWQRLHKSTTQEPSSANAKFVIDPREEAAPPHVSSGESMLLPGSPHPRKWSDVVHNKWFSLHVQRATPP